MVSSLFADITNKDTYVMRDSMANYKTKGFG